MDKDSQKGIPSRWHRLGEASSKAVADDSSIGLGLMV